MVRPAEFDKKEKDTVTSSLFLSSINSWHSDEGVEMVVDRVGKYFPNPNNATQTSFAVTFSILSPMEKCRARVIDPKTGDYVMVEDEITGRETPKIELISNPAQVTIFYKGKQDENSDEIQCASLSNLFPLLKFAFEQGGMDMSNFSNGFWFSRDELEEYLHGLHFIGKVEKRSMSGNSYFVLIPEELPE